MRPALTINFYGSFNDVYLINNDVNTNSLTLQQEEVKEVKWASMYEIISMIDEHEITRKAYDKKEEIVAEANENYRIMAKESKEYADELLAGVENTVKLLEDTLLNVEATIKQTVETIENNRKELK